MLAESHLYDSLERNAFSTTGEAMCIYGDPAYPLRIHLHAPFRNRVLTHQVLAFTIVQWVLFVLLLSGCLGRYQLCQMFRLQNFNLKIGLSQVGKMYIVCSIMQNALTYLYGNGTSQLFDLDPPSLEDYFA